MRNGKSVILIIVVIILLGVSFACGIMVGNNNNNNKIIENNNQVRNTLDGVYFTEIKATKSSNTSVVHSYIDTMTFYSNGTVSLYRINIYDVQGIGKEIDNGTLNSGTYTLSNESNTILIRQESTNKALIFENNYKTIKYNDEVYNLITGSIEENIPEETINQDRNTEFSGTYLFEEIKNQRTSNSSISYMGKTIERTITREYLTFSEDGKVKIKYESIQEYSDGTEEFIGDPNDEHEYSYSIDKANGTIFYYLNTYTNYSHKISNDLNEITGNNDKIYKLTEN